VGGQAKPRCRYTCSVVAVGESKGELRFFLSIFKFTDVSVFRDGAENKLVSTLSEAVGENGEVVLDEKLFVAITHCKILFGNCQKPYWSLVEHRCL